MERSTSCLGCLKVLVDVEGYKGWEIFSQICLYFFATGKRRALPMAVVWNFCIPQKSDVLSGSDLVEILMLDQQSRRA